VERTSPRRSRRRIDVVAGVLAREVIRRAPSLPERVRDVPRRLEPRDPLRVELAPALGSAGFMLRRVLPETQRGARGGRSGADAAAHRREPSMHADEVPARQRWADIERGNLVVRVVPVPRVALFARDRERRDGGAVDEVEVDAASAVREDELFLRVRHEFGKLTAAARCARPRRVARAIRRHTRRDDRRGDAAGDGRARDALGDDPVQPRDELAAVRRRDRSVILREVFRVTVRRSSAAAASGRVLAHRRERLSAVVAAEEVVLELRLAAAGLLRLAVGREERVDVLRGALLGVRHPVVDRSIASVDRSIDRSIDRSRARARDDRAPREPVRGCERERRARSLCRASTEERGPRRYSKGGDLRARPVQLQFVYR